jgi:hypothetical protein
VRRVLACLTAVPLAVAGSLAAHQIDYRLVAPQADARAQLLASTGHGYLDVLPAIVAACWALAAVGVVLVAQDVRGHGRVTRVAAWPFALLPPLAFAVQEHLERLVHHDAVPWHAALEPTFWRGVLLQLPFGLAAWLVARWLLRAAERVGLALRRRPHALPSSLPEPPRAAAAPSLRRLSVLAALAAGRAPPHSVSPG